MSEIHEDRVAELVRQASALPVPEREAFLRRECAGDEGLLKSVREALGIAADGGAKPTPREPEAPTSWPTDQLLQRLTAHTPKETRYTFKGEVARGGMGAILKVWDEDLRRTLAMKVTLGNAATGEGGSTPAVDDRTLGRFLEEAQVTGQLDHPGIVPVHELGLDDAGQVYFTMRLVKGQTLAHIFELAKEGKDGWTQTRALGVILKVCEAMSYAHSKGVIHRDLKPANVMVGRFGEVYVMDWGLAKVLGKKDSHDLRIEDVGVTETLKTDRRAFEDEDTALMTMDGTVVGTPAYMSPEQARGEVEDLDGRADVYSLGAMLYHLLAGNMPYISPGVRASSHAMWRWVMEGPPRPIHELAPGVPGELAAICEKAMARERDERYPDVLGLAEDLHAYIEGRVVGAYEMGALAEARKWVRRNGPFAAALATVVVLLVAGLAVSLLLKQQADEQRAIAESNASAAQEESYRARIALASQALSISDAALAQRHLAQCEESLRSWEWRYLDWQSDPSVLRFTAHPGGVLDVAASPDGKWIATMPGRVMPTAGMGVAQDALEVAIWSRETGARSASLPLDGSPEQLSFDPAGAMLYVGTDAGLRRFSVVDWSLHDVLLSGSVPRGGALTIAADGNLVAYARRVLDAQTKETVHDGLGGLPNAVWEDVGIDPLGRYAVVCESDELHVIDLARPAEIVKSYPTKGSVMDIAFSGDGSAAAALTLGGQLTTVDLQTRLSHVRWVGPEVAKPLVNALGDPRLTYCCALNSDGRLVATAGEDAIVRLWERATGELLATFLGHATAVNSLAFADNGDLFSASSDGTVRVWRLEELPTQEPSIEMPDGDWTVLVAGAHDGPALVRRGDRIRLWDQALGEFVAGSREFEMPAQQGSPTGLQLSSGGERFALGAGDGRIVVLDARTGEQAFAVDDSRAQDGNVEGSLLAFSDDGRVLVAAPRATWGGDLAAYGIRLFDGEGVQAHVLTGHRSRITSISVFGDQLATGSLDGTARVWDLRTGELLALLEGHRGRVYDVIFADQGRRVLSASEDRTVRVWDWRAGAEVLALREFNNWVTRVSLDAQERILFTKQAQEEVRAWRCAR